MNNKTTLEALKKLLLLMAEYDMGFSSDDPFCSVEVSVNGEYFELSERSLKQAIRNIENDYE